jgi:hypothetical protein
MPLLREFIPLALCTICIIGAPERARAADPTTRLLATTRPSDWHSHIQPFIDPDEEQFKSEMGYDPTYAFVSGPKVNLGNREDPFRLLITTRMFVYERVGGGGNISSHSKAFQTLLKQSDARELFLDLLDRGNDAAKLYALCGFCELEDAKVFRDRIAPFLKSEAELNSLYGCMLQSSSVRAIAKGIASGRTSRMLRDPYSK